MRRHGSNFRGRFSWYNYIIGSAVGRVFTDPCDGWRIVDEEGNELGFRKLWHPHENEQPITRTLASVLVPKDKNII